jgi:hypothetical protein
MCHTAHQFFSSVTFTAKPSNCRVKWAQQIILLQDIARLTTSCQTTEIQASGGFHILPLLSYSPVLGQRLCHVWQDQGVTVWKTISKQWQLTEQCLGIDACYQPSKSYQKYDSGVGSNWSVLQCKSVAVMIIRLVLQVIPNHLWTTLMKYFHNF